MGNKFKTFIFAYLRIVKINACKKGKKGLRGHKAEKYRYFFFIYAANIYP